MENDLRERLEALSSEANSAKLSGPLTKWIDAEHRLRGALQTAYESGELVPRSEMEEAVAKAVAEEREATIKIAEAHLLIDWENKNSLETQGADRMKAAIISAIRARSEQKEGE